MGKGFVLCAVVCSALALSLYAGLSEYLGFSTVFAVFVLLGICFLFHGTAIYMLNSRENIGSSHQVDSTEIKSRKSETTSRIGGGQLSPDPSLDDDGTPVMTLGGNGTKD